MRSTVETVRLRSIIGTSSRVLSAGFLLLGLTPLWAASLGAAPSISVNVEAPGAALVAGSATQFVIRVRNIADVGGGENRLVVPLVQGLQNLTWSCSARSGSQCTNAHGVGALNESLQGLGPDSTLEYVLTADIGSSAPPFVDVSAQVDLAGQARCSTAETAPCRASLSLPTGPGVMLDMRAPAKALNPGDVFRYTITAHTVSTHSDANGTVLRSPVPAGLVNSSWRCRSAVGACAQPAGQGAINQTLGNFSKGSVSFDVTATVTADAPASIVQAAVAVPPYGGSCAIANNGTLKFHSSPCSARNVLATSANILVSRSEDYLADASSIATRFVLDNNGSAADGSVVDAVLEAGVLRLEWTCEGQGATCPQASGSGPIHHTITAWPASGRLVYDLVSKVASSSVSPSKNVLRVTPSARGICAATGRSGACEALYVTATEHAGLKLSQSVDELGARRGDRVTYRINIGNGSSAALARDVVLHMALPDGIDSFLSWTCVAREGSTTSCPKSSGVGAIREMFAQLAPSSNLDYVIQARVSAHPPATISGRATLTSPASAGLGCGLTDATSHACIATSQFSTIPVIALDQSMSADTLAPGSMVDYFLDVFNLGAKADLVQVRNFLPRGLSNASWICSDLGMDCPHASGSGEVVAKLDQMPSGAGVRFHVSAQVDATQPQSATNVLTAVPSIRGRCQDSERSSLSSAPCVDRMASSFAPKIEVTQTAEENQGLRGGTLHHALIVKNIGGLDPGTRLALPLAVGITRSDWTCLGFAGAVCPRNSGTGAIAAQIANMPFNGYLQYSIRSVLANDAPSSISATATTTPGEKALCADAGCVSVLSLPVVDVPSANLEVIVKAADRTGQDGTLRSWDVEIHNLGSEPSGAFSLSSLADSGVSIDTWTCSGAECPATEGSGPIQQVVESLSVYDSSNDEKSSSPGRLHYVVNGTTTAQSETRNVLAIRVAPAVGDSCAPASCVADSRASDAVLGLQPIALSIVSEVSEIFPNSMFSYQFRVGFPSAGSVPPISVYSLDPVGVASSSWSCVANGPASCPDPAFGDGPINSVVSLTSDASVVFTVVVQTGPTIPDEMEFIAGANKGSFYCKPDSCMVSLIVPNGQEELDLSLNADVADAEPGGEINYTFTVANSGPGAANGVRVTGFDDPSFAFSSWICEDLKGFCGKGSGPLEDIIPFLAPGDSAIYTVTANLGDSLPPSIDYHVALSPVSPQSLQPDSPQGGLNCVPASCDISLSVQGTLPPTIELTLDSELNSVVGGAPNVDFVYTVSNPGPDPAFGLQVYGVDSPNIASSTWTCVGTGTSCTPSGTGQLSDNVMILPANSSLTYRVSVVFGSTLPSSVDYTAGVTPGVMPAGVNGGNGSNSVLGGDPFVCIPAACAVSVTVPLDAPSPAMLSISKIADRTTLTPGGQVRYTVNFANVGEIPTAVRFVDAIPAGLSAFNWTCASNGDSVCEQSTGSGPLDVTVPYLFPGSSFTYTVNASVSPSASGNVINRARLTGENIQCSQANCQATSNLRVEQPAEIVVSKSSFPAAGSTVSPGAPISWTLSVMNSGGPTNGALALRDVLPLSVSAISVSVGQGVVCDDLAPSPGSVLSCTIASGFTGQASVTIAATVAANASGAVVNTVTATGVSDLLCSNCSVSNPVAQLIDIALMNPRPFTAGGISGTLIDVVNLSELASAGATLSASPASALRLLSPFASSCTAITGADGSVNVSCQSPPETQGIVCQGANCALGEMAPGGAMTVFVALNGSSAATVQLSSTGDPDASNNTIELSVGGTP